MSREHLPEDDVVRVRKIVIETVTVSKTEGHAVLAGNLRESKRVNRRDRTTESVQSSANETLGKVKVGVSGLDDVLYEELAWFVGLSVRHI